MTQAISDGDDQAYVASMRTLVELENDPTAPRATLVVAPYTAIVLIGALQTVTAYKRVLVGYS